MKTEIQYLWRIKWFRRWTTTGHHCTEDQIRKEHPEAVRIDATRRELQIAETWDEQKYRAPAMANHMPLKGL